jgi:hypothetical protein
MVTEKGPGMQAPYPDVATDFYATYPFTCMGIRVDGEFYNTPRMVNHLDTTAIAQVTALSGRLGSCTKQLPEIESSYWHPVGCGWMAVVVKKTKSIMA